MSSEVIAALITATVSLVGVIITSIVSNANIRAHLDVQQAVADERIRSLTDAVKRNNEIVMMIPKLEQRVDDLSVRIDRMEDKK